MRRDQKRAEEGFTLLEVIIAISILSVGLLAVASMQAAAIRGNHNAYQYTEGTTWAQDRLEQFLSQPYDTGDEGALPSVAQEGYTMTGSVARLDSNDANAGQIVTVTASWRDRGVNKSVTLTSVKANL